MFPFFAHRSPEFVWHWRQPGTGGSQYKEGEGRRRMGERGKWWEDGRKRWEVGGRQRRNRLLPVQDHCAHARGTWIVLPWLDFNLYIWRFLYGMSCDPWSRIDIFYYLFRRCIVILYFSKYMWNFCNFVLFKMWLNCIVDNNFVGYIYNKIEMFHHHILWWYTCWFLQLLLQFNEHFHLK